jgi:hypothetical protein
MSTEEAERKMAPPKNDRQSVNDESEIVMSHNVAMNAPPFEDSRRGSMSDREMKEDFAMEIDTLE